MLDYYSILQIEDDAAQDEIKQAYHKMARLFHPDNFKGSQEEAAEQMAKINEAYQMLSNVDKRAAYDADRQLKYGKPSYDCSKRNDTHEGNNRYSEASKTNSTNMGNSVNHKADYVNEENLAKPNTKNASKKGRSSCLTRIIEWTIYIGILYFVISHFHLVDKGKSLLNTFNPSQYNNEEKNADNRNKLKPEEVVEDYFKCLKDGKGDEADKLFSAEADGNFQMGTVAEYNQVIVDLYYGFEKDIPTYPLYEEIRNFKYGVIGVDIDEKGEYAEVNCEIENCDVALLFGMILEADNENALETLGDSELQKLFRNAIKKYKDSCMINTNAIITLKKDQEGCWKIDSISPLKDFSTVIIGQADDLVLTLNGENVDNDTLDEKDENENADYEEDEDADMLW